MCPLGLPQSPHRVWCEAWQQNYAGALMIKSAAAFDRGQSTPTKTRMKMIHFEDGQSFQIWMKLCPPDNQD